MTESGKKRPRSDYYDRLLFQCQKELHKIAKQTKQFETKKLIRQLKNTAQENTTAEPPTNQVETRLAELKDYDVEPVVQECVRQLGLSALNPNAGENVHTIPVEASWMLDRLVHHKKMKAAIDKWHDEVAKYRRWCAVRTEAASTKFVSRENSLFVQLGGGTNDAAGQRNNTSKEPKLKKKNRQGQRARKAKALALEAKREGRMLLPEESLNWRAKKQAPEDNNNNDDDNYQVNSKQPPREAPTKQPQTDEAPIHPSWQARKDTKNTLVPFQGKKITF